MVMVWITLLFTLPRPVFPPALKPGDTVAVIAPASPPWSEDLLDSVQVGLQRLGFHVIIGPHASDRYLGYLAGKDLARAQDLYQMILRPGVRAIIALRGGYGTLRLYPFLLPRYFKENPKILVGMSDLTSLFTYLWDRTGLVTFYGPVAASLVHPDSFTLALFEKAVEGDTFTIHPLPEVQRPITIVPGVAEGRLLGGTLTVFASAVGTPYMPRTKGTLLFFEDINEDPYKIDRILTQLRYAGVFDGVRGVVFGIFRKSGEPEEIAQVVQDRLGDLGVPICYGLPFGHVRKKATLPIGVRAKLDASRCTLTILEPAVRP